MNDAVEGLEKFKNKKDLALLVQQLNEDLKKQTQKKNLKKEKRKLKEQPLLYFTIALLLILIVISFVLVKKYVS